MKNSLSSISPSNHAGTPNSAPSFEKPASFALARTMQIRWSMATSNRKAVSACAVAAKAGRWRRATETLEREMGFEPTNVGLEGQCSTVLLHPRNLTADHHQPVPPMFEEMIRY